MSIACPAAGTDLHTERLRHHPEGTLPVRSLFALALFTTLCACTSNNPDVALPQAGVSGPGGDELMQSVALDGRYIDSIRIAPEGWQERAPGQQVTITFEGLGLAQVKQFEIIIEAEPASAFALDDAVFTPQAPFITPFATGIQLGDDDTIRLGGASLAEVVSGNKTFGALTLTTKSGLGSLRNTSLRVTLISIGPSSNDRERYEGEDLRFGVQLN
ncbi:MAG: hypothetical protein HN404_26350 [Gemmatimonadetes bacterium]|nr:hypothetical protein [Gemmatimonadota bacterium]